MLDAVSKRPVDDARLRRLALETAQVVQAKAAHAALEIRAVQRTWPRARAMVICRSRRAVATWTRSLRRLELRTYGAFSGSLSDGLDESKLNPLLALNEAEVVVVCGKLEAGYDDLLLACLIVDRHVSSPARLVQIYSRVNRASPNKPFPRVVDFANGADFVAFAFRRFWRERKLDERDRSRLGAAAFRALSYIDAAGAANLGRLKRRVTRRHGAGRDAAASLLGGCRDRRGVEGRGLPRVPSAYARQITAAIGDEAREDDADAATTFAAAKVSVAVGVVGGGGSSLAVEAVASLPTHGGAGPSLRPGESLADLTRRAARGHLASVLASVTSALADAPDAASRLAALRRLDRLAVTTPRRSQASGRRARGRALKSLRIAAVAALARRVVSEAKARVAAALPPDATPKPVALGLPQDIAAAVAPPPPETSPRRRSARSLPISNATMRCDTASRRARSRRRRLVELGADEPCREDRKRKAPPPIVEEEILAEGLRVRARVDARDVCHGVASDDVLRHVRVPADPVPRLSRLCKVLAGRRAARVIKIVRTCASPARPVRPRPSRPPRPRAARLFFALRFFRARPSSRRSPRQSIRAFPRAAILRLLQGPDGALLLSPEFLFQNLCANQQVSRVHCSRRWRGGRSEDSARRRCGILIYAQTRTSVRTFDRVVSYLSFCRHRPSFRTARQPSKKSLSTFFTRSSSSSAFAAASGRLGFFILAFRSSRLKRAHRREAPSAASRATTIPAWASVKPSTRAAM